MIAAKRQQDYAPPDEVNGLLVRSLCERAAELAAEAEIGGAFVYQLPVLSAFEWLALRALHNARNKLKAEAEAEASEARERERQRAELAARLGQ